MIRCVILSISGFFLVLVAVGFTMATDRYDGYTGAEKIIRQKCEGEWPSDFSMQKYCIDQQREAVQKLKLRVAKNTPGNIMDKCANEWPFDPKKDYPMVTAPRPANEWHFTATTRKKSTKQRIAAIMLVKENGEYPVCYVKQDGDLVYIDGEFGDDKWSGVINLGTEAGSEGVLLELEYQPSEGERDWSSMIVCHHPFANVKSLHQSSLMPGQQQIKT